jgi:signal transduction histidine kinase
MDIEFEDTGEGIMPENLEKVFEPYFTTKEVGIGLGLAITKRIIEEHNGEIRIESQPLKGTTVKIKLRRR